MNLRTLLKHLVAIPWLLVLALVSPCAAAGADPGSASGIVGALARHLAGHPGQSGVHVLEKGEESLLARAWLADRAAETIDVQYFIWSTDNIGILAAEALLRAAERGVRVRVIVDDLLVDGSPESMVALAAHPNVGVRIYNPLHSVGVSFLQRLKNLITDFRGANQRMHDKTLLVDGVAAITGGRNMADEYFDYDQAYNFRDRDVLVAGPIVGQMGESFEAFWASTLAVPVETLLSSEAARLSRDNVARIYADLHAYAANPENFAPQVRGALRDFEDGMGAQLHAMTWGEAEFLHDRPGKNDGRAGLAGGGITTTRLVEVVRSAKRRVTIQSPYLVLPEGGVELLGDLVQRGVRVRISTNSLASTDNLQAFSGYASQRRTILEAGIEVREFRPDAAVMGRLIDRLAQMEHTAPIFAIHAKTLVVDQEALFVGTFNLDPRSANLNTEVGVLIRDASLARRVETAIETDMAPENSWNPAADVPDGRAGWVKRAKVNLWRLLPIEPLL